MQDVVNGFTVIADIVASVSVLAGTLVKRLARDLNIVERHILIHVGIGKCYTGAIERSIVSSVAAVFNINCVSEFPIASPVKPLGIPALLQDLALRQIETRLINQATADLIGVHVTQIGVVTIVIGNHNIACEQELGVCFQCVGGSQIVNRSGQRVGSLGHLTVVHAVHHGDGLDGHRLVNGDRTFIESAALGGLATINGVVDGGTLDGRNGYRLDGVVLTSPRIDHRCLHLMNNLRDAEGLVGGIDGDGIFTSLGQLDDRVFIMTRNIRRIQVEVS